MTTARERTVVKHLVMVNWRGVFFQAFGLDRHVTALEGTNGVGKTTVMAAAYVVLMPQLRYIHFAPIGETGSSSGDRGLHGRLGMPSRPSYAALDCLVPGEGRVIAAVQLEALAVDQVKIQPFIITGTAADTPLADIFLDRRTDELEAIPDRDFLRTRVHELGGEFLSPKSLTEYGGLLFTYGIAPLPVSDGSSSAQRWADLLRTSMNGGLSVAVTSGLKEFLLRREDGLNETLETIRENLLSCKRTQIEVEHSQKLREVLDEVCNHGQRLLASSLRWSETSANEARAAVDEVATRVSLKGEEQESIKGRLAEAKATLVQAQDDLLTAEGLLQKSREHLSQIKRAHDFEMRIAERQPKAVAALKVLDQAKAAEHSAGVALAAAERIEGARLHEHGKAVKGLNQLQAGLAIIAEKATRHEVAVSLLKKLALRTPSPGLSAAEVPALRDRIKADLESVAAQLSQARAEVSTATASRSVFFSIIDNLAIVIDKKASDILPAQAHDLAQASLQRVSQARALAAERAGLGFTRIELERQARLQADVRRVAADLGLPVEERTAIGVDAAATAAHNILQEAEKFLRDLQTRIDGCDAMIESLSKELKAMVGLPLKWANAQTTAKRIADAAGLPVMDRDSIQQVIARFEGRRDIAKRSADGASRLSGDLEIHLERLTASASGLPAPLRAVRDATEGSSIADRFDNTSVEDAPMIEARLGPWRNGLIVDDVQLAASVAVGIADVPDDLLFLLPDTIVPVDAGSMVGDKHFLVQDGAGYRLTRCPAAPVVGRLAREARIESLRKQIAAARTDEEQCNREANELAAHIHNATSLMADVALLSVADPEERIVAMELDRIGVTAQKSGLVGHRTQRSLELGGLEKRKTALQRLLRDAAYLDMTDQKSALQELDDRIAAAERADHWLKRVHEAANFLERTIHGLRRLPIDADGLAAIKLEVSRLELELVAHEMAFDDAKRLANDLVALDWTDAPRQYREEGKMLATINEQAAEAQVALEASRVVLNTTRVKHKDAADSTATAKDNHANETLLLNNLITDRKAIDIGDASEAAVTASEKSVVAKEEDLKIAKREVSAREKSIVGLEKDLEQIAKDITTLIAAQTERQNIAVPLLAAWDQARRLATERSLLSVVQNERFAKFTNWSATALRTEMAKAAEALSVTLKREKSKPKSASADADDLDAVVSRVRALADKTQVDSSEVFDTWSAVHRWMQSRLPSEIAASDDLFAALRQLETQLGTLREQHERYERRLTSNAEEVGQKILTACRKAQRRIGKLNETIQGARFGSVLGMRVDCELNKDGQQRLAMLRGEKGQQLLWDGEKPFSEAISHLLGETGGSPDRFLDYRTYLDMKVQVQRLGEPWSAVRVSTGEAIGVGAVLMMATMSLWEDDYRHVARTSLRSPMRFLFLDEANRLDQTSQATLMDLCRRNDLQLLVAAPEIASVGDNTTYRLSAIETDGHIELQVRPVVRIGRRQSTETP